MTWSSCITIKKMVFELCSCCSLYKYKVIICEKEICDWQVFAKLYTIDLLLWFCLHKFKKASAHRIKREGKRGQPCCKPLYSWIMPFVTQLIITKMDIVDMHLIIKSIHFSEKPSFCIVVGKKHHSNLSYVLLISSFKATFFFPLLSLILCKHP